MGKSLMPSAAFAFLLQAGLYASCGAFTAGPEGEYPHVGMFLLVLIALACRLLSGVAVAVGFVTDHTSVCILALICTMPALWFSWVIFLPSVWQITHMGIAFAAVTLSSFLAVLLFRTQRTLWRRMRAFT